jgi:hypothetical protein
MNRNHLAALAASLLVLSPPACSDDENNETSPAVTDAAVVFDSAVGDTAVAPDAAIDAAADVTVTDAVGDVVGGDTGDGALASCGNPSPTCAPTLGAQIDRMGRPAVNTALTDPFWDDGTRTLADHHAVQDAYNEASDPATWATTMIKPGVTAMAAIQSSLAVYDALNGTGDGVMEMDGCGDQLAYNATFGGTMFAGNSLLATVLADDRLYVNTGTGVCNNYLAVEANALGMTNPDCGGRTPLYRVVDITYQALINGKVMCPTTCDFTNGVPMDPDPGMGLSATMFPFLGAPSF